MRFNKSLLRSEVFWRTLALFGGTALGQGSLFLVSLYWLSRNASAIGHIGVGYGIATLVLMVVDLGGSVRQRQMLIGNSIAEIAITYSVVRLLPAAVFLAYLGFSVSSKYPTEQVANFLLGATPGVLLGVFNFAGVLDVKNPRASHTAAQGASAVFLSIYLLLTRNINYVEAGLMFSVGCLFMFGMQLLQILFLVREDSSGRRRCLPLGPIMSEGLSILVFNLPGQFVVRLVAIAFIGAGHAQAAATYNVLKQAQGIFNQCVTLLRRAEYNLVFEAARKTNRWFDLLIKQKISIILGGFVGTIGVFFLYLFSRSGTLPPSLILVFYVQSVVWLATSAYFFSKQVIGENYVQGIYGMVYVVLFCLAFYGLNKYNLYEVLFIEMICVLMAFFISIFLRYRLKFINSGA